MKQTLLRNLLLLDAVVLFLLGAALVLMPERVERGFNFSNLPAGVSYITGLWGCALLTMSMGYVAAAKNPVRQVVWLQVGIARGGAEFLFGCVCVARGLVSFRQAVPGIVLAGLMSLGYLLLYPRKPRLLGAASAGAQTKAS